MHEVLQYWFSDASRWFDGAVDADARARFADRYAAAAAGDLDGWKDTPDGAVALAVLLERFRPDLGPSATDTAAIAAAEVALTSALPPVQRASMALCLTRSEDRAVVARGIAELTAVLRSPDARSERKLYKRMVVTARRHLRVVDRFGRDPRRNTLLGRETTDDEAAWLSTPLGGARPEIRTPAATRLRILVLHGFTQSGTRLASRMRKIQRALEDIAELVFLDGPHVPSSDPADAHRRAWWRASDDHRVYAGWEESIRLVDAHLPIDGVLGFSQGAVLAGLVAALRTERLRFAICISGFPSRADAHRMLTLPGSIDLPSLHVYGEKDTWVEPERTRALADCFVGPRVVSHTGGHYFPELWPTDTLRTFLLPFLASAPPPRELDDPRWHDGLTLPEVAALLPSDVSALLAESRTMRPNVLAHRIWLAAWQVSPDAVRAALAEDTDWTGLVGLATFAADDDGLLDAIADRFALRIAADEADGLSLAAEAAPRTGSATDRISGLGRRIAAKLRPDLPSVGAYVAYRRRIVALSGPVRVARRRARLGSGHPLPTDEISPEVTRPRPVPVVPCLAEELTPLLTYLSSHAEPLVPQQFSRGTVMPDGRLDLCKQVVGPEGIGPLLSALSDNVHVDRLLLGNNVVGRDGAHGIARFIRSGHSRVNVWYIAGNEIDAEGLAPICDALGDTTDVAGLWLKRNPLGPEGAIPLAALLRKDPSIETLDLVNTGLLDEGALRIVDALRDNRRLRHLYLGTNGLTAVTARALGEHLATEDRLESLYVDCNRLGDEGVALLADGLRRNRNLRRLGLASNRIGPEGARVLADALADHPSLVFLNLGWTRATQAVRESGNVLGDDGCRAIADLVRRNRVLRVLDVAHNGIGPAGVEALFEALSENRTLVSLRHPQNGKRTNADGVAKLRGRVDQNRREAGLDADGVEAIRTPRPTREVMSVYRTQPMD